MAAIDAAALLEPLSADEPCGPDLDLEGDPDFLGAIARIEGILPASFFRRDDEGRLQPFDRSTIDFAAETKILVGLLERTRDLRVLTLLARLNALNRDLAGFAQCLAAVAGLLGSVWADVHPRGEDGDYGLRSATLGGLDDMPTIVLPLQHVALAESRRLGAVTLRTVMAAEGEIAAPEGSEALDRGAIERVLGEADLDDLKARRAAFASIAEAAGTIYATTVSGASFAEAVNLEKVTALSKRAVTLLDGVLALRDPSAAAPPPDDAGAASVGGDAVTGAVAPSAPMREVGAVSSMAEAAAALAAVSAYLATNEPSTPAELLVRQARSLVGKSFLDVLRTLVPAQAEEAKIGIGADRIVELSYAQLEAIGSPEPASSSDGWGDTTADGWGNEADRDGGPAAEAPPASSVTFQVGSRREATALMGRVASFYRTAEPSSPIPLLIERALATVERDFLTILRDVLPGLGKRDEGSSY